MAASLLSHKLVTLRDDVPLSEDLDALVVRAAEPETLFPFLDTMELRTLAAKRLISLAHIDSEPRSRPPSASPQ